MASSRAQRRLRREANRDGFVEITHAEILAGATSAAVELAKTKAENERLEKKVTKLKAKVQDLSHALKARELQLRTSYEDNETMAAQVEAMAAEVEATRQAYKSEMEEKMKYWRALTDTLREVEVLEDAIRSGEPHIAGYGQAVNLCEPLP